MLVLAKCFISSLAAFEQHCRNQCFNSGKIITFCCEQTRLENRDLQFERKWSRIFESLNCLFFECGHAGYRKSLLHTLLGFFVREGDGNSSLYFLHNMDYKLNDMICVSGSRVYTSRRRRCRRPSPPPHHLSASKGRTTIKRNKCCQSK